jgi:hypothetical protein
MTITSIAGRTIVFVNWHEFLPDQSTVSSFALRKLKDADDYVKAVYRPSVSEQVETETGK